MKSAFRATVVVVAPAFAAEPAVGIVMEVSGATDPPLSAMTEITADTPIKLSADVRLTFLDYARCKLVTVAAGTVTLSRSDYKTDGHIDSETDAPCPQTYSTGGSGTSQTTGGLIIRGGLGPPRWPINSQFLLTGRDASGVAVAAIYTEDSPDSAAATLTVTRGRLAEQPGKPLPPADARYILRLTTGATQKLHEITFIGTPPSNPPPFIVLRLD